MNGKYSELPALEFLRSTDCRAIVFDMDGVLADTEEFHLEAWIRLVANHDLEAGGRKPSEGMLELIRETFGQSNDTIIPLLWGKAGRNPGDELEALSHEKESCYRDCARGRVRPMPGIEAFLHLFETGEHPRCHRDIGSRRECQLHSRGIRLGWRLPFSHSSKLLQGGKTRCGLFPGRGRGARATSR